MAFTLEIRKKGDAPEIDFGTFLVTILNECGLEFGSYNDFYVLDEGKVINGAATLYNPDRVGRGIYLDAGNLRKGEVTVSYNIPTTASEIRDFVKVVKAIQEQLGDVSLCEADLKETYTIASLEKEVDSMIGASGAKLRSAFLQPDVSAPLLTLAKFPWMPDEETWKKIGAGDTMDVFEETLHEVQTEDIYYAKPALYRNAANGGVVAVFTLPVDCDACFPVEPGEILVAPGLPLGVKFDGACEAVIMFVVVEENRAIDGLYPYSAFVEYAKAAGAEPFDANRIRVPGLSEEEILAFIRSLEE